MRRDVSISCKSTNLGFLFRARGNRRDLVLHVLHFARQPVVLVEELAKMRVGGLQLMDAVLQLRELVDQIVVFD